MFMSRSRVRRGDIRVMGAPTHPPLCRRAQEKCCEMTAEGEGERRGGRRGDRGATGREYNHPLPLRGLHPARQTSALRLN